MPVTAKPGCAACGLQPLAHESHHVELSTAELAFQPNDKPITTTAVSAAVFAKVNVFWTILPSLEPARARPRQQRDQRDRDQLLRGQTDCVTA